MTIQMKAIKRHFSVVLFVMLYKMVLFFESVYRILKGDSIELHCASFLRIISCIISAHSQREHIDNLIGFI